MIRAGCPPASFWHFLSSAQIHDGAALAALAALMTLCNAVKPLHVDDPYYYAFASHIARSPLDPYGFEMTWDDSLAPTRSALHWLAPPVFIYWVAGCISLCGHEPFLLKLGLLPFVLVFVASLHQLLRRFAWPLQMPLTWLIGLSPGILPSINLMPDIPALALELLAYCLFLRAFDDNRVALGMLAGLVSGLAMQTKYTGLVIPLVFLAYGLWQRRLRVGVSAALTAGLIFFAWEAMLWSRYGESHFLHNAGRQNLSLFNKCLHLVMPFFSLWGGVGSAALVLGLLSINASRRVIIASILAIVLGLGAVAYLPDSCTVLAGRTAKHPLYFRNVFFGLQGCVLSAIIIRLLIKSMARNRRHGGKATSEIVEQHWASSIMPNGAFLYIWLAAEIVGYFVLSPFPAVRRILGVFLASTVLLSRLGSHRGGRMGLRGAYRLAAFGAALGGCFYAVDLQESISQKQAAALTVQKIHSFSPARTWCLGRWGFSHYAQLAGMANGLKRPLFLKKGDILAVGDSVCWPYGFDLTAAQVERLDQISITDHVPLRTVSPFYGGRSPCEHLQGPRITVGLYRVINDVRLGLPLR
jgi:hypothetical protein